MAPEELAAGHRRAVADEDADEDVDDDAVAVRGVAQEHRVGERQADPGQPQHGQRRAARGAPRALEQRDREHERQRGDEDEQDRARVAPVRRRQEPEQPREPGQPRGTGLRVQAEELVQAGEAEQPHPGREDEAPLGDDEDRERDGRDGDEDPPAHPRPADRPARRALTRGGHQRPPKRRRRDAYSARLASNASRVKSGQSSSRKTSSL